MPRCNASMCRHRARAIRVTQSVAENSLSRISVASLQHRAARRIGPEEPQTTPLWDHNYLFLCELSSSWTRFVVTAAAVVLSPIAWICTVAAAQNCAKMCGSSATTTGLQDCFGFGREPGSGCTCAPATDNAVDEAGGLRLSDASCQQGGHRCISRPAPVRSTP